MNPNDVNVQFEGFSPSNYVKTFFNELLEEIHEEAPTWATVRASIHGASSGFRGVLRITSGAGEFFATASSSRLTEVGYKLRSRIRRQLDRWKARRFSRESIRGAGGL